MFWTKHFYVLKQFRIILHVLILLVILTIFMGFCGIFKQLVMDNAASGSGSTQDASLLTQEDTVSLVKNIKTLELRDLRKQLLDKPAHLQKKKIKEEKQVASKYNGNQKQFYFNCSVIQKLGAVKNSLDDEDIESEIEKVIRDIKDRNKLIKNADRTEGGWSTVEKYEICDYADYSDDYKKIRQANTKAPQKKCRLQPRRPAMVLSSETSRSSLFRGQQSNRAAGPLDICFCCGLKGHFEGTVRHRSTAECRRNFQSNSSCSSSHN